MKHLIISICFVFILIGCVKKSNQSDDFERRIRLVGEVVLDERINNFVEDFMNSLSNPNCIYELYIDKKAETEYYLTLFNYPNTSNYLSTHFPVNYTIIDGRYVFIYSGLEDFIKKEYYKPIVETKDARNDNFESTAVLKVILKDTSYIAGNIGLPFTDIKFNPPIIFKDPK